MKFPLNRKLNGKPKLIQSYSFSKRNRNKKAYVQIEFFYVLYILCICMFRIQYTVNFHFIVRKREEAVRFNTTIERE